MAKRREIVGDVNAIQDEALNRNKQEAAGNLSNMPQHMADIGSDNFEQELSLVLVEGERAILREIDEALERIENGTYGICAATGKPIGKARLRARPWAKYCYEYVLAQETGKARRF
ncbi:MAG: TraR/DksA family transcriptional regulator [Planctomycetota bacterium]|nr:MAG: TraR/DksA family transcriptional regulator [Planctomycetota bacterium]